MKKTNNDIMQQFNELKGKTTTYLMSMEFPATNTAWYCASKDQHISTILRDVPASAILCAFDVARDMPVFCPPRDPKYRHKAAPTFLPPGQHII